MKSKIELQEVDRFNIIFEKLEEAKKEQGSSLNIELEISKEVNIAMFHFKEFQESIKDASYTYMTKA